MGNFAKTPYTGRNMYLRASFDRVERLRSMGSLSVLRGATLKTANGTHAQLLVARSGKRSTESTAILQADEVIAAVGFSSDSALIDSMGFPTGALNPNTFETSLPGVYNLGVGGIAPWHRISERLLRTDIEDSVKDVDTICRTIQSRHQALHGNSPTKASGPRELPVRGRFCSPFAMAATPGGDCGLACVLWTGTLQSRGPNANRVRINTHIPSPGLAVPLCDLLRPEGYHKVGAINWYQLKGLVRRSVGEALGRKHVVSVVSA